MSGSVFLAHAMSSADDGRSTDDLVRTARAEIAAAGWTARPAEREPVTRLLAEAANGAGPGIVAANVDEIARCDLLLILAEASRRPSSVWVEAGIALSARVPGIVIAGPDVPLPFLISAAIGPAPEGLAPWHHIVRDLFSLAPSQRDAAIREAVTDALTWAGTVLASGLKRRP